MIYLKLLKHTNVLNASTYFNDTRNPMYIAHLSLKQGFAVCEGQFLPPPLHGKVYIFKSLANQSMMCKSMRNKSHKSIYIEVEIVTNLQFLQPKNFLKHFF